MPGSVQIEPESWMSCGMLWAAMATPRMTPSFAPGLVRVGGSVVFTYYGWFLIPPGGLTLGSSSTVWTSPVLRG